MTKSLKQRLVSIMPFKLKNILFQTIFDTFSEEQRDLQIQNTNYKEVNMTSMLFSLRTLKKLGFDPKSIVDIGACKSAWTRKVREIFPNSHFLMIEAQKEKEVYLEELKAIDPNLIDYQIALLGATFMEKVPFYQTGGSGTGSSVFKELSDVPTQVKFLQMDTLDNIIKRKKINKVFF
ncbi:hypothetical protein [Paenibacillus sp. Y412MC10]|uniref:hypothetical protein n=1 Tax=Geobacillus sp. (strain Y412MC10) TaxID=481743 RepID=UPI0011AB4A64|nr:hypothetical protein [Paenibacillus sp. Y412MC10]